MFAERGLLAAAPRLWIGVEKGLWLNFDVVMRSDGVGSRWEHRHAQGASPLVLHPCWLCDGLDV